MDAAHRPSFREADHDSRSAEDRDFPLAAEAGREQDAQQELGNRTRRDAPQPAARRQVARRMAEAPQEHLPEVPLVQDAMAGPAEAIPAAWPTARSLPEAVVLLQEQASAALKAAKPAAQQERPV